MGQLISQHVNREESKIAINQIFPPNYYGYAGKQVLDQVKDNQEYNEEIEGLLTKYAGNYKHFNSKDSLQGNAGYGHSVNLKSEMA